MLAFRSLLFSYVAISLVLGLASAGLLLLLPAVPLWGEGLAQWLFFFLLTGLMIFLGQGTVKHRNPNLFSGTVLGGSMIKLFGSLIFLFAYQRIAQPEGRSYLVLFFSLYVGFTVLEIILLQRMVRTEAARRRSEAA